jgi:DNA-directed RNA polymerase beta' subunit
MNVHAPQSFEAEAELRYNSIVSKNIITAQESKPIITITQDSLIASYLMTRTDFPLTKSQFCNLCMKGEMINENKSPNSTISSTIWSKDKIAHIQKVLRKNGKKSNIYTSRGLLSMILPSDFNYKRKNEAHPEEPEFIIEKGVIIAGAHDKNTLGSSHGSIIQLMNKEYGHELTANFIDNMQFLGNNWLMIYGFSIGLEDCMNMTEEGIKTIEDNIKRFYAKAQGIKETTQNEGIREVRITACLSQARDLGMVIAKEVLKPDNNFLTTVKSGAKGDYFNIAQINGVLGQQNLENKRVKYSMNHQKRSLPHYPFEKLKQEREYESRGFVRHSFIRGLNPQEFFFHAMAGRENVADTANGTAKSGYNQRKIVKGSEDMQVQYDNTVRDSSGKIYQYVYGDNGYNSTKTTRVGGNPSSCDVKRLADRLNTRCEMFSNSDLGGHGLVEDKKSFSTVLTVVSESNNSLKNRKLKINITNKIKKKFPYVNINEDWSVEELKQRLETLETDSEEKEVFLSCEEQENNSDGEEVEDELDLELEEKKDDDTEGVDEEDEDEEEGIDNDLIENDDGEDVEQDLEAEMEDTFDSNIE